MASIVAENQVNGNGAHDAASDNNVAQTTKTPVKSGTGTVDGEDAISAVASSGSANKVANGEAPAEVTKRSIRVQTWKKIEENGISVYRFMIFNRIPNFIGAEKAAQLFAETPEFQQANHIKIDIERTLDAAKFQVLSAGKNLYISKGKRSTSLFAKVISTPEEEIEIKKKAILPQHLDEHGAEINFPEKVELDIVVFGSVAVSKTGQRIGRGNGYVDLDFAILKHCGCITNKTIIVTIVHDEQIYDTLPNELFTNYDVPVDIIITPTQVIRVEKKLSRPEGIQWQLLSERRLGIVPVLKSIKEHEEQAGKVIVLKEEDTDVESSYRNRRRFFNRYFGKPNRRQRSNTEGDNNDMKPQRPRRRLIHKVKQISKTEDSEQSSSENKKTPTKARKERIGESDPNEVSKRSIRLKTWKEFAENRCAALPYMIYNRVPNFIGAEKAANLLAEIDEFQQSKTIKVCSDKAQDPVKIKVINDNKDLFVAPSRDSNALYTKITCPGNAESEVKQMAIRSHHLAEYGADIEFKDKVEIDMLVIGSVAVSKLGHRLGRGNGYVDLDFGILVKAGAVTDKTVIVTTVHDQQVCDSLPEEIFCEYDVPVDVIVTPTQVIRVENRRKRPTGIYWNLLTNRRLKLIPVLKAIKDKEESEGNTVELRDDGDTDGEGGKPRTMARRFRRFGRGKRRTVSENNSKNNGEGPVNPRRRFFHHFRKPKQSITDGEQSSSEKKMRRPRKRQATDYCVKVSRIPRTARPRTFKAGLKEHGCNPMYMVWKGNRHTCYLYFGKKNIGGESENKEEEAINLIKNALDQLSLTDVTNGNESENANKPHQLRVEIVKRNNLNGTNLNNEMNGGTTETSGRRIETVEVSAV